MIKNPLAWNFYHPRSFSLYTFIIGVKLLSESSDFSYDIIIVMTVPLYEVVTVSQPPESPDTVMDCEYRQT